MREFIKFVAVRGACAVLSYAVYLFALIWFSYEISYVASYVFGIGIAYYSSAVLVFREPLSRKSALLFPLVYVFQFLAGYFLIRFAVESLGIPEGWGLAFSVAVTLPVTFLMSRWVVRLS
ncbi:MAG TPA: GtrA family protein [Stenotrophomonas sp.]|jgi:putative flippase GtrA